MRTTTRRFTPTSFCRLVAGLVIVLTGMSTLGVRAEQVKTANDGIYTDAQATRGQGLYGQQCASCHAADLTGSGAPPLAGKDFLGVWESMSVDDVVEKIATSMPSGAPGSLSRIQSSDLVAFILRSNNFSAGPAELDPDSPTLKTIKIVK